MRGHFSRLNAKAAKHHLVELHHQGGGRPAGVIEGQEEDAEQPGRAVHQGGGGAPQALLGVAQQAVGGPVWKADRRVKLLEGGAPRPSGCRETHGRGSRRTSRPPSV